MPPRLQIRPSRVLTNLHPQFRSTSSITSTSSLALRPTTLAASNRLTSIKRHLSVTPRANMTSTGNSDSAFKISNLYNVKDKIALVTGAGTGIGLMATQALAVNGAKVYIVGRTEEKLEKVAELYGKNIDGQIIPLVGDVTKKEDIKKLVEEIKSREKCLCILVNNAGISLNTQETEAKTAEEMSKNLFDDENETFENWTETHRTNVASIFFMTTAFLPLLQAATDIHKGYSGGVVNITSMSGIVKTSQHHYAYNASKAAAIHVTTMLANDIAQNGLKIRVNSIAPGVFPSEMTASDSNEQQKSHVPKDKYKDKTAAERPGKDEDMASAILFAATNQYLNGITIPVEGGYILMSGAGAA